MVVQVVHLVALVTAAQIWFHAYSIDAIGCANRTTDKLFRQLVLLETLTSIVSSAETSLAGPLTEWLASKHIAVFVVETLQTLADTLFAYTVAAFSQTLSLPHSSSLFLRSFFFLTGVFFLRRNVARIAGTLVRSNTHTITARWVTNRFAKMVVRQAETVSFRTVTAVVSGTSSVDAWSLANREASERILRCRSIADHTVTNAITTGSILTARFA